MLALHGLPALRFLATRDDEERMILTALGQRAAALRDQEQRNLAAHIINALAKALRRG